VASARSALAITLRPVSVIVGLVAAGIVSFVIEFGALTVAWYAHQPTTGLLYWSLSLVSVVVSEAIGGYVAARLSRSRGFAAAVAVGAVGLLPPLISILLGAKGWWPWPMSAAYLVLFVPAAAAGAWFALRGRSESVEDDAEDSGGLNLAHS
jgi:hypothetical protein